MFLWPFHLFPKSYTRRFYKDFARHYVTFSVTSSNLPHQLRTLLVPTLVSALYQPTLKARHEREGRKPAYVRMAEHSIPSKKECTFTASNAYVRKVIAVEPAFHSFYGSRRCKRIMHDSTKARRGEYDVATNALLRMADGHIGRKRAPGGDVLFAIGLCNFNTRKRLPSLHTSFAAHFVNKLLSLGYLVVGVDEFYTSKKCPGCESFVGQVSIRWLHCPTCQNLVHRDIMASQNIAKIALAQVQTFARPTYLTHSPAS